MKIVRITGPGLAAISLLVAALWGCFVVERLTVRNAQRERARIIYDLQRLQRRMREPLPASAPIHRPLRAVRPSAG